MEISVECPYCGETLELYVDRSGGSTQNVEDFAVCCQPMEVIVELEGDESVRCRENGSMTESRNEKRRTK